MSRPRREGEGRRADTDRTLRAGGGSSRRATGAASLPPAGSARVPPRDRGWRARRPLTAGPGEGLGAGPRAPPPPTAGPRRGEGNRRTTKETTATEAGAAVLGPSAVLGTKELWGRGWFDAPSPNPLQPLWARRPGPGVGNRAAAPGPARDGRAVSPRLLPLTINHRICHRFSYSPAQSVV